jgi:deoxyribonuclease-4
LGKNKIVNGFLTGEKMLSFRFGTVGAPISNPKRPGGSVGAILRLAELDLSALELGWVRSVRVSEKTCLKIKHTAQEKDVAISVHAPYYINLNADEDEWPKSRKRLMDAAHFGNLAGATDIIFHPGSYFGQPAGEVVPGAIDRLQNCVEELRAEANPVILRPETMGKSAMLGSLDDTLMMSQAIEGVEPCLDFAHLHARPGDGSMNTADEWRDALEAYAEALGESSLQNLHIHLSGIEYTPKGEKEHLPILESDFDLEALLKVLAEFRCGGRIVCESPVLEEDAFMIKEKWQQISGEAVT